MTKWSPRGHKKKLGREPMWCLGMPGQAEGEPIAKVLRRD